jgi:hypothetical protein
MRVQINAPLSATGKAILERLRKGARFYGELPASEPRLRAWVGLYPFKGSPYGPRDENEDTLPWRYRVRKFEVDRTLIEGGYDIHEEELERKEDAIVDSEAALIELLRRWPGLALSEVPGDYPI